MTVQISKVELSPVCPFCNHTKCHIAKMYKDGIIEDAWWICQGCKIHYGFEQIRMKGILRWKMVKIIPPELPPGYGFVFSPDY